MYLTGLLKLCCLVTRFVVQHQLTATPIGEVGLSTCGSLSENVYHNLGFHVTLLMILPCIWAWGGESQIVIVDCVLMMYILYVFN